MWRTLHFLADILQHWYGNELADRWAGKAALLVAVDRNEKERLDNVERTARLVRRRLVETAMAAVQELDGCR